MPVALKGLRVDAPVAMRATKILEDTMLPINYRRQRSIPGLPKSYQQCELTFLLTIIFRATKILSTARADISANRTFQGYQNLDNFKS